jgi:hypothetical protein
VNHTCFGNNQGLDAVFSLTQIRLRRGYNIDGKLVKITSIRPKAIKPAHTFSPKQTTHAYDRKCKKPCLLISLLPRPFRHPSSKLFAAASLTAQERSGKP